MEWKDCKCVEYKCHAAKSNKKAYFSTRSDHHRRSRLQKGLTFMALTLIIVFQMNSRNMFYIFCCAHKSLLILFSLVMTGERTFDVIVPSVLPLKRLECGVSTAGES